MAADLALLLCDHHGASLIVTAGHTASIEEFFDELAKLGSSPGLEELRRAFSSNGMELAGPPLSIE